MEIRQRLNSFVHETDLSLEMLEYASQLLVVHKELQKEPELFRIPSPDNLPKQSANTLQNLAKCMGTAHDIDSKDE